MSSRSEVSVSRDLDGAIRASVDLLSSETLLFFLHPRIPVVPEAWKQVQGVDKIVVEVVVVTSNSLGSLILNRNYYRVSQKINCSHVFMILLKIGTYLLHPVAMFDSYIPNQF